MLRVLRAPLRHYRELILAGTFAALAAWEILEMLLLERVPETSLSLALVVHSAAGRAHPGRDGPRTESLAREDGV